jgi:hypothetical protein
MYIIERPACKSAKLIGANFACRHASEWTELNDFKQQLELDNPYVTPSARLKFMEGVEEELNREAKRREVREQEYVDLVESENACGVKETFVITYSAGPVLTETATYEIVASTAHVASKLFKYMYGHMVYKVELKQPLSDFAQSVLAQSQEEQQERMQEVASIRAAYDRAIEGAFNGFKYEVAQVVNKPYKVRRVDWDGGYFDTGWCFSDVKEALTWGDSLLGPRDQGYMRYYVIDENLDTCHVGIYTPAQVPPVPPVPSLEDDDVPYHVTYSNGSARKPRVLVACEYSGYVRHAFIELGYDAVSCDILPTMIPGEPHLQCDVREVLNQGWDMLVAFPPCTYLCRSGAHLWKHRQSEQQQAIDFFMTLVNAPISHIAIENPIGIMSRVYRKPDQYIQPYEHGHPFTKRTCLWLKDLPLLLPSKVVPVQKDFTSSIGPGYNRGLRRSMTFKGIAEAMASQWGPFLDTHPF